MTALPQQYTPLALQRGTPQTPSTQPQVLLKNIIKKGAKTLYKIGREWRGGEGAAVQGLSPPCPLYFSTSDSCMYIYLQNLQEVLLTVNFGVPKIESNWNIKETVANVSGEHTVIFVSDWLVSVINF